MRENKIELNAFKSLECIFSDLILNENIFREAL